MIILVIVLIIVVLLVFIIYEIIDTIQEDKSYKEDIDHWKENK